MPQGDEFLPLTPRVFLILWALARSGPLHGYAMLAEVEELGGGQVRSGPASLYESIQTLRKRGLIEPVESPPDADARRRYFGLTSAGEAALRGEARRLSTLVASLRDTGVLDKAEV